MRFYLAHPVVHRHEVRKLEFFAEECGMDLLNPFYDSSSRDDIKRIDAGLAAESDMDPKRIVEMDLANLNSCDAVLMVPCGTPSTGASMEMAYAYYVAHKPIFVIDDSHHADHLWIRYHATRIFRSWSSFIEAYMNNRLSPSCQCPICRRALLFTDYEEDFGDEDCQKIAVVSREAVCKNCGVMGRKDYSDGFKETDWCLYKLGLDLVV